MSPRPKYSADEVAARRDAILESALELIAKHGPQALRMKDIAEAAGVSVGTLQHYFGSRDVLLVQAFSAHTRSVVDAIAGLSQAQGTGWEKMTASLRAVPSIGDFRRRSQVWIELVAASRRNEFLRVCVDEVFDYWSAHFRAVIDIGIRDGSFRPRAQAGLIVETLIAQIDGFDLAAILRREPSSPDQIVVSLELTAAALLGVRT